MFDQLVLHQKGHKSMFKNNFLLVRLAQHFLKKAKDAKKMGLAELVSSFFKETRGVGTPKAFLPPKQASCRSLTTGRRSKVYGRKPTCTPKPVPCMQKGCVCCAQWCSAVMAFFVPAA